MRGPQIDKINTGDLFKGLITDYTVNKWKSIRRVEDSVTHLEDSSARRRRRGSWTPRASPSTPPHGKLRVQATAPSTGN
jgi:hypothetical protein